MKKSVVFGIVSVFLLLVGVSGARADSGPVYLYLDGYCNVYMVRLTADGTTYGERQNCGDDVPCGGSYITGDVGTFAYELSSNTPYIVEFYMDNTWMMYQNMRTYLSYVNSGTWSFGGPPLSSDTNAPSAEEPQE